MRSRDGAGGGEEGGGGPPPAEGAAHADDWAVAGGGRRLLNQSEIALSTLVIDSSLVSWVLMGQLQATGTCSCMYGEYFTDRRRAGFMIMHLQCGLRFTLYHSQHFAPWQVSIEVIISLLPRKPCGRRVINTTYATQSRGCPRRRNEHGLGRVQLRGNVFAPPPPLPLCQVVSSCIEVTSGPIPSPYPLPLAPSHLALPCPCHSLCKPVRRLEYNFPFPHHHAPPPPSPPLKRVKLWMT